jgi:uncharacterized membrane protein
MNYQKLIKDLTNEMKKGVQYKRIPDPYKLFVIIAMIPLIISFAISKFSYAVTVFFYKALSAPAEHLQHWLTSQKNGVQHATEAVMYFVCLPYIFTLQVMLSLNALSFYFQWFTLMIQGYLLTLGGIKWQPYISDATFEDDATEYDYKPQAAGVLAFSCIAFGACALCVFMWLLGAVAGDNGGFFGAVSVFLMAVHWIMIVIVNPCMFKRTPKAKKSIEEPKAE